jgi:biopolymer transport protein ExbB
MTPPDGRRYARIGGMMLICLILMTTTSLLTAQSPDAAAPALDAESGALPRLAELFNTSPLINSSILILSIISLGMFLYFLFTLTTSALAPRAVVDDIKNMILKRRYDDVTALCRTHHKVFISTIIQRCVENAGKEHSVILDMIDSEGRRRADIIWNRISYLADIANIAPMLGLLGTVSGMIQAFYVLPSQSASINSRALAEAIGAAMSTTLFGLTVAIITTVFYSFIRSRVTRVLADCEEVVHSVADHIKRGGA